MINGTQVTLRVDVISNISWSCYKRNFLFELFYLKYNLADQINKNNYTNSFQPVFKFI